MLVIIFVAKPTEDIDDWRIMAGCTIRLINFSKAFDIINHDLLLKSYIYSYRIHWDGESKG